MNIDIHDYDWRAISIKQPWLQLITDGLKPIENRLKGFKHETFMNRPWVLLHSSTALNRNDLDKTLAKNNDPVPEEYIRSYKTFPIRAICGFALIDRITTLQLLPSILQPWAHDGDACIYFSQIYKFDEPVPTVGALSAWRLSMKEFDVKDKIKKLQKKFPEANDELIQRKLIVAQDKYKIKKHERSLTLKKVIFKISNKEYTQTYNGYTEEQDMKSDEEMNGYSSEDKYEEENTESTDDESNKFETVQDEQNELILDNIALAKALRYWRQDVQPDFEQLIQSKYIRTILSDSIGVKEEQESDNDLIRIFENAWLQRAYWVHKYDRFFL
jgi:hypothetical protein